MKIKAIYFLLLSFFLVTACAGGKKALSDGNFDKAITEASLALKKNKDNEKQALVLQEAYKKATDQDLALIDRLKQQAQTDPTKWLAIYDVYDRMLIREIQVKPLQPLYADGRQLDFDIPNVDVAADEAKQRASDGLYEEASRLLSQGDKLSARKAYELYDQLIEFNFDYADAREKRELAKTTGSTNVLVKMNNQTGHNLPATFEDDLLTFREGSFSDPWILYHTSAKPGINYEYHVDLAITQLIVGRNDQQQRQFREQKQVIVGYKDVKNAEGQTVKQPQYGTVYADVMEVLQTKPIRVAGTATYKDATGKVLATMPIQREEAWRNNFAEFRGDQRALSQETIAKVQNGPKEFPTDQQLYEVSGKLLNQVVVQLFEQSATNLK